MNKHIALFIVAIVSAAVVAPRAQEASERPRFEVASIKPNVSNDGRVSVGASGSRYTATGVSLALLIRNAYRVQEFQIIGAPSWAESDRFDIVATMPAESNPAPVGPGALSRQALMMQALLEERFHLVVRKETRDMPVYALVTARADRAFGPSLRRSTDSTNSSTVAPGSIRLRGQTMAQFATALSFLTNTGSSLGRLIVDRTGLEGNYDVDLHFTPDRIPNFGPGGPPQGLPPIDPDAASIYAAMREQLGLKLDAQRAPVDVIVVDRVEKPTAD
jgi:bla regulator protein blaR1